MDEYTIEQGNAVSSPSPRAGTGEFAAPLGTAESGRFEIVHGVLREEAREVLRLYARQSGTIYNG